MCHTLLLSFIILPIQYRDPFHYQVIQLNIRHWTSYLWSYRHFLFVVLKKAMAENLTSRVGVEAAIMASQPPTHYNHHTRLTTKTNFLDGPSFLRMTFYTESLNLIIWPAKPLTLLDFSLLIAIHPWFMVYLHSMADIPQYYGWVEFAKQNAHLSLQRSSGEK